ncbi:hypothetical protein LMG29542_07617 [Paraburkholderia humisilvae]|uniref:Uncharacterized protein n=1 Tax=Paraburkholderia humisilvae TaxID=627669 RepID=A0A6J5FAC8_9BURK|nr:hypothetical protein LMG29542_07617 [Paraburkholderia humisilvae]
MDASRTALHGQDTTITGSLYVAFELGDRSWKLSLGDGVRAPSRCMVSKLEIVFSSTSSPTCCFTHWRQRSAAHVNTDQGHLAWRLSETVHRCASRCYVGGQ